MLFEHDRLIILDFDHCLFNTTLFVDALKVRLKKDFNISPDEFDAHRQAIKDCCVVIDIDNFVKEFSDIDANRLHGAISNVISEKASMFIFQDAIPFIERHREKFDILIETHGDKELQTEKIKHSGVPNYVNQVISLEPKEKIVEQYIKQYKEIFFFDDKVKNIDAVKTAHKDVTTYLIERPEDHPYGGRPSTCECADHVIKDLDFTIE